MSFYLRAVVFENIRKVEAGNRKEKHLAGLAGRGWGWNGDLGLGLSAETKGIPFSSPFLTHGSDLPNLSFAFRRTLQATMLRFARLDGSVAVEEEGTRGDAGMRGWKSYIFISMILWPHPSTLEGGRQRRRRCCYRRRPVGNLYFIAREILAIYSRIRI